MSRGFQALSLITFLSVAMPAWAQLDASSAVLLKPMGKTQSKQNLDSSRYKIRAPESRKEDGDDDLDEKPGTLIPSPVPSKVTTKATAKTPTAEATTTTMQVSSEPPPATVAVPTPVPPVDEKSAVPATTTSASEPTPAPPTTPPVTEQVRELILGGSREDFEEYKTQIHRQDPRANTLDISLAPAYFYNDSSSSYSYRRYNSNGPGLGLGMNFWMTPFFGVQSKFFSSVSSSVRSGATNMVPMDVQTFEAGFRFRKHFGYSRKAPHLSWGIDYHDSINKINREATTLIGRKSNGLSLAMEAVIPTTVTYANTLGIDVRPKLKHSEMNTGVEARSGAKSESNAVSLAVGGQWTLDKRNQVFWKGQYSVERNLFKGQASDPTSPAGSAPDGVSVTNSLMMLYFGFRWGS